MDSRVTREFKQISWKEFLMHLTEKRCRKKLILDLTIAFCWFVCLFLNLKRAPLENNPHDFS